MSADISKAVERLKARLNEVAEQDADTPSLRAMFDPRDVRDTLTALSAKDAELAKAREALVAHNELLRSAFTAAQRDAAHDVRGTTNYRTLADRAHDVLKAHHSTVNQATQALGAEQ